MLMIILAIFNVLLEAGILWILIKEYRFDARIYETKKYKNSKNKRTVIVKGTKVTVETPRV